MAAAAAAPTPLAAILARLPIPGFNADGSVGPVAMRYVEESAKFLPESLILTIAGEDYYILKLLGGGSYGKVWAALQRSTGEIRTIKIIKYNTDSELNNAKSEAVIGALVHNKTPRACSPVYGVGTFTTGSNATKGSSYFALCGDRYSETLDDYVHRQLGLRGPPGSPPRKQFITDILYGLYRTLRSLNTTSRFNHGDPKLDNYMIFRGVIRIIDMGFGHFEESGINVLAMGQYNSNNNDTMRDLLQNLLDLYIYTNADVPDALKSIAATIIAQINTIPDPDPTAPISLWHKTYDYVNDPTNKAMIEGAVHHIVLFLKSNTTTALTAAGAGAAAGGASPMTPLYADGANSHPELEDMRAVAETLAPFSPPIDPYTQPALKEIQQTGIDFTVKIEEEDRDARAARTPSFLPSGGGGGGGAKAGGAGGGGGGGGGGTPGYGGGGGTPGYTGGRRRGKTQRKRKNRRSKTRGSKRA